MAQYSTTLEELKRWREDFKEYSLRCLKIIDKHADVVPLKFNRVQDYLWKIIQSDIKQGKPTRLYILKARQLGTSTFCQALKFWSTTLQSYRTAITTAHSLDSAEELFRKCKIFYNLLPDDIKPSRKLSNRRELHFAKDDPDGNDMGLQSKLTISTAKDPHLGAGRTIQTVHLSEFARYDSIQPNAALSLATLLQTVPNKPNTFVIIETTAWGLNFSSELWFDQEGLGSGWTKVFISWIAEDDYVASSGYDGDLHNTTSSRYGDEQEVARIIRSELIRWYPERKYKTRTQDLEKEVAKRIQWRREKIDTDFFGDLNLFKQEYPLTAEEAFVTTGRHVFDTIKLTDYRHAIVDERRDKTLYRFDLKTKEFVKSGIKGLDDWQGLCVWEEPKGGVRYVIGADVSEGLAGGDFSTAQVLKIPEMEQVAVYRDHIDPASFADLLRDLSRRYNSAYLGVETNGPGFATTYRLHGDLYYGPFMYTTKTFDSKFKRWTQKYGWHTNRGTKNVLITDLRRAINEDMIRFNDTKTIDELLWYIQNEDTGSLEAASGKHDDLVMSMGIALQLVLDRKIRDLPSEEVDIVRPGSFAWAEEQLIWQR